MGCYPGEDLQECSKRFSNSKTTTAATTTTTTAPSTNTSFNNNTTCLGTKKDHFGFLGVCVDQRSDCNSGVTSSSLDCGSATICCQDSKASNSLDDRRTNGWT